MTDEELKENYKNCNWNISIEERIKYYREGEDFFNNINYVYYVESGGFSEKGYSVFYKKYMTYKGDSKHAFRSGYENAKTEYLRKQLKVNDFMAEFKTLCEKYNVEHCPDDNCFYVKGFSF